MQLTQYQINEFTRRAKLAGLSDQDIQGEIEKKMQEFSGKTVMSANANGSTKTAPQQDTGEEFSTQFVNGLVQPSVDFQDSQTKQLVQEPMTVEGFVGNVGKSAVRAIGDTAKAAINILNPDMKQNTIANLAGLGIDAVKLASGDKSEENKAMQVVNYYKKRYGEDLTQTLYEDPVGVLLDISTVMGGAGGLIKGAGELSKVTTLAKVGGALEATGAALDPLAQTAKVAGNALKYTKVADKVAEATQGFRQSIAETAATKSIRANPTQITDFEKMIGTADQPGDIGKWMTDNGIYTKEDVTAVIKTKQAEYNNMVRTDTPITGKEFADALINKAKEIESNDISPSARAIAQKLRDEAKNVAKKKNITDTILTNSKTSSFGKVSKKSMTTPIDDNFNKAYSQVGLDLLDTKAPGSAAVGKELQALRTFDEIVGKQKNLGRGSQLINIFKPFMSGAILGAAGGSFAPGVGNAAGALVLGAGSAAASNPFIQRSAAKLLIEGINVPQGIQKATSVAKDAAGNTFKYGRMLDNSQQEGIVQPSGTPTQTPNTPFQQQQQGTLPNQGQPTTMASGNSTQAGTAAGQEGVAFEPQGYSYPTSISQESKKPATPREEAVQFLYAQGVTDPHEQIQMLNYDEKGNKVNDFTLAEVVAMHPEHGVAPKTSSDKTVMPSVLNPFGSLTKKQVLRLAVAQGAKKADIESLSAMYDAVSDEEGTMSEENIKLANDLRTQYQTASKNTGYQSVKMFDNVIQNASPTAQGDMSLIFAYMKMLDPNSTVREGEYATAQNAASVPTQILNAYNKAASGQKLSDEQRAEYRKEADKIIQPYKTRQAGVDAHFQGFALKVGLSPTDIGIGIF